MIGRRCVVVASVGALVAALVGITTPGALAQEAATESVQVQVVALTPTGPSGLAVLTATEDGTGVQVLVPEAPEDTVATIHPGTCAAIGPDPVGLLGLLGGGGQAQATVPLPISTLADGKHVIALHPGLDFETSIACGAIPLLPGAEVDVTGTTDACVGVPEWVASATGRLDRLGEMVKAQDAAALDLRLYLSTIASNIGELRAMADAMRVEDVPAAAATVHQRMLAALELAAEGGQLFLDALVGGGDVSAYQEALTKSQEASKELLAIRTEVGTLKATCPG
jgi:hypothetical protein